MVDEAHKQTDTILYKLEKALRQEYSSEFAKLKKAIRESVGDMSIDKSLTPIERYNESMKYNRLDKIVNEVAEKVNSVNKSAISQVNKSLVDIYKTNYNGGIDLLAILLAQQIPSKYAKTPNTTEANEDIKEEKSPFDVLAIDNAKDITELRRAVDRQFITAIMRGDNTNELINRIEKVVSLKLSDIVRIARTETTRIENLGRLNAYEVGEKMGYTMAKVWVAVGDNRTRLAHKEADGQTVPINEPFIVHNEKLMYPGDPNGSAENVINCRCSMRAGIIKK